MICADATRSINILNSFNTYIAQQEISPLFLLGDARSILTQLPDESIDFCMTSPPYWNKRQYHNGGIGLEDNYRDYITELIMVFKQVKRILKPTGSFWLVIGDSYLNKLLVGIPWRVALRLTDEQGWTLRNSVVWNKVKGGLDNTHDRLANVHENIFHFVKTPDCYYYNVDAIRTEPRQAKVVNGAIVSATGVSGVRYKRQIELSTALTNDEKAMALKALEAVLMKVKLREIADFRMVIRGQQRTTHSDSARVSGRARELQEKGFYFLFYHPKGSKPGDVWDILPEDTQKRLIHFAPYPEDICKIPILATCPPDGVVLDPFCGTGTTMRVAQSLGRKSIGIDICEDYLLIAEERCFNLSADSNKTFGMNWKMTAKTILVQLHHKVQTFQDINKHLVLVIQNHFMNYIRQEFRFDHLNTALIGDSAHFHVYKLNQEGDTLRLGLDARLSTDANGIAECLGLQTNQRMELEHIVKVLKARISAKTLFSLL